MQDFKNRIADVIICETLVPLICILRIDLKGKIIL